MRKPILSVLAVFSLLLAAYAADIPAGTQVSVRLGQTISSNKARSGDNWTGTLHHDVLVNGRTVARRGDPVEGKVVEAQASGRLSGTALIELQLTSINGTPVISDTYSSKGGGHKGRNAKAAGGGAVAGAIIGAIAGGGKGAAIGAGAGAAAGTAGAAATGKKDIRFPVETILDFTIR
ncbi:MAG TPA: hypothetical protein VEU96_03800 [Bryobacteraceae bacterium]|nr:hypothetical protein [Bryobacteraceae bacterium]